MRCELHRRLVLPGIGDADALPPALERHVGTCLACQAERARYRKLSRLLVQLRTEQAALGPGMLSQIVGAIGAAAEQASAHEVSSRRRFVPGARAASVSIGALALTLIALGAWSRLGAPRRGAPERRSAEASRCYR